MLVLINLLYKCAHTICSMTLVHMAHFRPLNKVTAEESHAHEKISAILRSPWGMRTYNWKASMQMQFELIMY